MCVCNTLYKCKYACKAITQTLCIRDIANYKQQQSSQSYAQRQKKIRATAYKFVYISFELFNTIQCMTNAKTNFVLRLLWLSWTDCNFEYEWNRDFSQAHSMHTLWAQWMCVAYKSSESLFLSFFVGLLRLEQERPRNRLSARLAERKMLDINGKLGYGQPTNSKDFFQPKHTLTLYVS